MSSQCRSKKPFIRIFWGLLAFFGCWLLYWQACGIYNNPFGQGYGDIKNNTDSLTDSAAEDSLLFSGTDENDTAAMANAVSNSNIKPKGFKGQVRYFFACLKANNINEASKYSTEYGLQSLLALDLTEINSYKLSGFETIGNVGKVSATLNNKTTDTTLLFVFRLENNDYWKYLGPSTWTW